MSTKRKILVTSALPYANGSLHLGNIVEFIQTDIWVRFQKMRGHDCLYICGSDTHGTPVMLQAKKRGISPEEIAEHFRQEQMADLDQFLIDFDNFYTTHSEENRELSELIYKRLKERGDISTKTILQAYDEVESMFLPDRFVKGICPRCNTADQYGDSCDACGATYSPTDLKEPVSSISGATPISKPSEHYFFNLNHYEKQLKEWTQAGHLQPQVMNKLNEWFDIGLQHWDISRDAPYFGFEIPDAPGKYFYVWLDAPVGYIASFKNYCDKNKGINFEDYWNEKSDIELYHFIGKDIIYFHALFWPAMLMGAKLRTPTAVYAHGFLTIEGKKMSKSRGTFIKAQTYLKYFNPEALRYYIAAKLSNHIDDIDLNYNDFITRVNSDLVGKIVNIASRCAKFINKFSNDQLAEQNTNPALYKQFTDAAPEIANYYEEREFSRAIRKIMQLADLANQYIDEQKPWVLIKKEGKAKEVQAICSLGINLFRVLIIYLKPVLPKLASQVESFLQVAPLQWDDYKTPLLNHAIQKFKPLLNRIDIKTALAMKEEAQSQQPDNHKLSKSK